MSSRPIFGRRNFLSGLGVAGFALSPLMRAVMKEQEAFAAAPADAARLVIIPIGVGWGARRAPGDVQTLAETDVFAYFKGDAAGNLVLPAYFGALSAYRSKMNCFDGFTGTWWGNAHDVSWSDQLTNFATPDTDAFLNSTTESIDAIVASSWQTKVIRASQGGGWGGGLECWVRENGVVKKALQFRDPNASFQAMAGLLPVTAGTPSPMAAKVFDRKRLLMDYVHEDLGRIKQRVPATAFNRLQEHLDGLAALQVKVGDDTPPIPPSDGDKCFAPTQPGTYRDGDSNESTAQTIEAAVKSHFEIIRAGLACGTHRVAMMSLPNGFGPIKPDDWDWVDSNGQARKGNIWSNNFHEDVSHWDKPDRLQDSRLAWEGSLKVRVKWVADFVASLDAIKYADGSSLLDKTFIVLTGEVADGSHNTTMKPMITIGGGSFLRTGRYVEVPRVAKAKWMTNAQRDALMLPTVARDWGSPYSLCTEGDWWHAVSRAMGVNIATFGNPNRLWRRFDIPTA